MMIRGRRSQFSQFLLIAVFCTAFGCSKDHRFSYFGKIVDQAGNPIPGVRVSAQLYNEGFLPSWSGGLVRYEQLVSDGEGRFELKQKKARLLTLHFEKSGYVFPPESSEGIHLDELGSAGRNALADVHNPIVVTARRQQQPNGEAVIRGDAFSRLPADGTFHRVSVDHYLIEVSIERHKLYRTNQEWSARLRIPGGEVQETAAGVSDEAPDDGYLPYSIVRFTPDSNGNNTSHTRRFFIRNPDLGLYGHLKVVFRLEQDLDGTAAVVIDYHLKAPRPRDPRSPEARKAQ